MGSEVLCGAGDCRRVATEALRFHGMAGHVHNCTEDAAINREWCDVSASMPIVDSKCPYPCTVEPIYTAVPAELADVDLS